MHPLLSPAFRHYSSFAVLITAAIQFVYISRHSEVLSRYMDPNTEIWGFAYIYGGIICSSRRNMPVMYLYRGGKDRSIVICYAIDGLQCSICMFIVTDKDGLWSRDV